MMAPVGGTQGMLMRLAACFLAIVALAGCGDTRLSASRASELVRHDLTNDDEVRMSSIFPRCHGGRNHEACVAAARCVEPIASDHAPLGEWTTSWIITGYPVFRVTDVQVTDLTNHLADGVAVNERVRETATVWLRFSAAESVQAVSGCPAFAALLGVLSEPVPFDAEFEGTPTANGQQISWTWEITMLRPQRDPADALPRPE